MVSQKIYKVKLLLTKGVTLKSLLFILPIKVKRCEVVYTINFSPKTLQKNLKGTAFDLPMLIKNEDYEVKISIGGKGQEGKGQEGKGQEGEGQEGEGQEGEGQEGEGQEGEVSGPSVPPEIKKNRNEIFRLLLKNYGKHDGAIVYGDGFKK